jgi:hypothetical protein
MPMMYFVCIINKNMVCVQEMKNRVGFNLQNGQPGFDRVTELNIEAVVSRTLNLEVTSMSKIFEVSQGLKLPQGYMD